MEPRIQYANTSDGVSIAYWTLGEGPPLLHVPFMVSHIEMEWHIPEIRRWYEALAQTRMLIRYDHRGYGLSDRNVSSKAYGRDVEAVVESLGLESFDLFGALAMGSVAIRYAAQNPHKVAHLLLWCTWADASDYLKSSQAQSLVALRDKDWETYTETAAHLTFGWAEGEPVQRFAAMWRESITPDAQLQRTTGVDRVNATSLLPHLTMPTLVLHRREFAMIGVDVAKGLASQIPKARLALLEGDSGAPFLGDTESVLRAIDEFLGEGEEAEPRAELPEGMAVILFADIVESTALTEQLGDAAFRDKARELDEALRTVISECSGTPVEGKLVGDGVLAVFTSARQAIDCALRCNAAGEPAGLQLHLGIHAGDVIREGNNVYGGAVNIAARIAGASAPGEVLVSDTVRSLARTSAGVAFDDRGERSLKGVAEPQRLFAVRGGADG